MFVYLLNYIGISRYLSYTPFKSLPENKNDFQKSNIPLENSEPSYVNNNYKDQLLKHFIQMNWKGPVYIKDGDIEMKIFKVYVKDTFDNVIGVGSGTSARDAEQISSYNSLIYLGIINENNLI